MTSNIGSDIIQKNFEKVTEKNLLATVETTKIEVMERLKLSVRPEFLNRIDEVVMFNPLMKDQISGIVRIQLDLLAEMLAEQGIEIMYSDAAVDQISEQGFDPQFGARPVKRVIQKELTNALSKLILSGEVNREEAISVDSKEGRLVFANAKQKTKAGKKEKA